MVDLLFDAFELQKMGEYSDDCGGTFYELFTDNGIDEECLRTFWVIFGNFPSGGGEVIMEIDDADYALEVYDYFCTLLRVYKNCKNCKNC